MTSTRKSVWVAAAVTLLAAGSVASAQQSRPNSSSGSPDTAYQAPTFGAPNNPYSDYPAAEVQAIPAAKARAAIAKMELLRAQAELNRGTRAAVRGFDKSDDVTKATNEQQQAYQQYQAAREKALQPLRDDKEYQAAQVMKDEIGKTIADKHAEATPDKPVSMSEIFPLAWLKLNYAMRMTQRESEALRHNADVNDARSKLASATNRVTALRTRFDQDLREDPDLVAARRAVFDQKVAMVAAQSYLAGLREARGIAIDYAYFVRRHNPYRVMGYDPYGFNSRYYAY